MTGVGLQGISGVGRSLTPGRELGVETWEVEGLLLDVGSSCGLRVAGWESLVEVVLGRETGRR
jgi:hypothetical protein